MERLIDVIMRRDGLTREEAQEQIDEAKEQVAAGADPEEMLHDEFGLEPDFFWDLID